MSETEIQEEEWQEADSYVPQIETVVNRLNREYPDQYTPSELLEDMSQGMEQETQEVAQLRDEMDILVALDVLEAKLIEGEREPHYRYKK